MLYDGFGRKKFFDLRISDLVFIPFEYESTFGLQYTPALIESVAEVFLPIFRRKNTVFLCQPGRGSGGLEMRRVEDDERKCLIPEGHLPEIDEYVRFYLQFPEPAR